MPVLRSGAEQSKLSQTAPSAYSAKATTSKSFTSQGNSEAITRFVKRKIPAGDHTQRGFVLKEEKLSDYFALRQARLAAGLVSQEAASASVRIARMNHRSLAKPLRNSSN